MKKGQRFSNEATAQGIEFAKRFAGARIRHGFTQEDMSQELGVSSLLIHRWERGLSTPPNMGEPEIKSLFAEVRKANGRDYLKSFNVQEHKPNSKAEKRRQRIEEKKKMRTEKFSFATPKDLAARIDKVAEKKFEGKRHLFLRYVVDQYFLENKDA